MSELITVPNFIFEQGNLGDSDWTAPLMLLFYSDGVSIESVDSSCNTIISYDYIDNFCRELKKKVKEYQAIKK